MLIYAHYFTNSLQAAHDIWEKTGRYIAPNGALMRTSILGIFQYHSIEKVVSNTLAFCKVTHADPRYLNLQRTPR